jgi:hypothetical protein
MKAFRILPLVAIAFTSLSALGAPSEPVAIDPEFLKPEVTEVPDLKRFRGQKETTMRGSTAVMMPNTFMKPARVETIKGKKQTLPDQFKDTQKIHTERDSRTIQQFMHGASLDEAQEPSVKALFAHRENVNKKKVFIKVDLRAMKLKMHTPDGKVHEMPIAKGAPGHLTERFIGCYDVKRISPNHKSSEFGGAPMPNANFFVDHRGIAIHQGNVPGQSHGCVRLDKKNSLFVMTTINNHREVIKDPYRGNKEISVPSAEVCVEGDESLVAKSKPKAAKARAQARAQTTSPQRSVSTAR